MCLVPITLKTNKDTYHTEHTKIVPCGKCVECLRARQSAWAFRLHNELDRAKTAHFLTLTYEEQPLTTNGNPTLVKTEFPTFIKKVRKNSKTKGIKYYACGEYGTLTKRPHYHAITYNIPREYADNQKLEKDWELGHIHVGDVSMAAINYATKYLMKGSWNPENELDDREKEFSLMSKNLGLNYLTPQMEKHLKNTEQLYCTLPQGQKINMPRYYKEKIFTNNEAKAIRKNNETDKEKFRNEHHKIQYAKHTIEQAIRKQREDNGKI